MPPREPEPVAEADPERKDQQRISLSLTENYAPSWGAWEGVREFVQNWHDGLIQSAAGGSVETVVERCDHGSSVRYVAVVQGVELGSVEYDTSTETLTLINRNVALARKVLLLGHSVKAQHADVAGQFGEGMKVGALALLREGRAVVMHTAQEQWSWARAMDPNFAVRVLTIFVSPRDHHSSRVDKSTFPAVESLGDNDTCTQISSLSSEEWEIFKRRFLFLEPPVDSFSCVVGTLLLDSNLSGHLYSKGIYIADYSRDGLRSGVDLREIRLDRDRRAVAHPSDIEHQASSLWVRAVEARPDLVSRLYVMLAEEAPPPEVKHAAEYLQGAAAVDALAQIFLEQHGATALPVGPSTATHSMLQDISTRLASKAVVCNGSLMAVLSRSTLVGNVEEMLAQAQAQVR